MTQENGAAPPRARQTGADHNLAARYAPLIRFDRNEPFLPLAAGYTIMRADGESPSFKRRITLAGAGRATAALVIEYAIWWDWDIQHLYELEHTWTYVGESGEVVCAEASWHGGFGAAVLDDGSVPLHDGHPVVYSQPGKHAFKPHVDWLVAVRDHTAEDCGEHAGSDGLLVTGLFESALRARKTPQADALASAYLQSHAFVPAGVWDKNVLITGDMLVPWPALRAWIPQRIVWCLDRLAAR